MSSAVCRRVTKALGLALFVSCFAVGILPAQMAVKPLWLGCGDPADPTTFDTWGGARDGGFFASASGYEVAPVGDLDSDGSCDFITTDPDPAAPPTSCQWGQSSGAVRIYSGRATYVWKRDSAGRIRYPAYEGSFPLLLSISASELCASTTQSVFNFGYDVASATDVNGDGVADIVVGAPGGPGGGQAFVFCGKQAGNGVMALIATVEATASTPGPPGPFPYHNFGWDVAGLGDLDGDGYGEVAISAPGREFVPNPEQLGFPPGSIANASPGHVFIAMGHALMGLPSPASFPPAQSVPGTYLSANNCSMVSPPAGLGHPGDQFGFVVTSAGEYDGVARPDGLLVGTPGFDPTFATVAASVAVNPPVFPADVPISDQGHNQGAVFAFEYDAILGFVPRSSPACQPTPIWWVGRQRDAHYGIDVALCGGSGSHNSDTYIFGGMGRSPTHCSPGPMELQGADNGYTDYVSSGCGELLDRVDGGEQTCDQGRYGAYVAGDHDLDSNDRDCDVDGDGFNDVLASAYRRKVPGSFVPASQVPATIWQDWIPWLLPEGCPAGCPGLPSPQPPDLYGWEMWFSTQLAIERGSMRIYNGYKAAVGVTTYEESLIFNSWACDDPALDLVRGGGTIDGGFRGLFFGQKFGEAIAFLPMEGAAEGPRVMASRHYSIQPNISLIEGITTFGAISVAEAGPEVDHPRIEWRANSDPLASSWMEGTISVELSKTAQTAGPGFIASLIPSLSLTSEPDPSSGIPGHLKPPSVSGAYGDFPIYTWAMDPSAETGSVPPYGPFRFDYDDSTSWWDLSASATSGSATINFDIRHAAVASSRLSSSEHDALLLRKGTHVYFQLVEYYPDVLGQGRAYKTSNLLAIRVIPQVPPAP